MTLNKNVIGFQKIELKKTVSTHLVFRRLEFEMDEVLRPSQNEPAMACKVQCQTDMVLHLAVLQWYTEK